MSSSYKVTNCYDEDYRLDASGHPLASRHWSHSEPVFESLYADFFMILYIC
jgi:hypothetical protein